MINLFAGLRSQITLLKEKLKKHNPTKNPKVYKEILDALEAAEKRYTAERAKKVEKQKARDQKAKEVEAAPKVEDGTVSMPKKEFVDEHEKLVKELEPIVEEHKEQGAELKEVKEAAPAFSPKCAICGVSFKSQPEYQQHKEDAHGHRDYSPMDPAQKKEVVKNVEHKLGPAIISEQEPEAALIKFSLDDVVKPIRGSESTGKVMRWDGKPSDLVYVAWDSGPLADRDGFGGYYPNDLEHLVEEPIEEKIAEGNPPPSDTSILPKEENCPCYDDMSVYCPKCKTRKTSDLKSNYEEALKDLKEEREAHYQQSNNSWVAKLDDKIKKLEQSIAEKFGNEKTAVSEPMFQCENCHAPMGPTTPSHLEHDDDGQDIWHCNEKTAAGQVTLKQYGEVKKTFATYNEALMWLHRNTDYSWDYAQKHQGWTIEEGNEKVAGAQNATELTIMDHTPARANTSADEIGKDTHDEMQDEWAEPSRDIESARGVPGSLFDSKTAPHVIEQLKSFLNAPYVNAQLATLGGPGKEAIMLTISADPKEKWVNGILQNSRYGNFYINNDGEVEQFSGAFAGWKQPNRAFRKSNVKSVQQLVDVLNAFLVKVNTPATAVPVAPKAASLNEQAESDKHKLERLQLKLKRLNPIKDQQEYRNLLTEIDKLASLKIASIPVTVFNKQWSATPVTKEGKLGYDISDESGKKVLHLSPLNGKEMKAEHLKWAAEREITKNYKKASLKEDVAFMKKGSKVWVISDDGKKAKIANLEAGVRAYVQSSKIQLEALESQAVQFNGQSCKVLGQTATETLIDSPTEGPVWVSSSELLSTNQPVSTPEAYPIEDRDIESSKVFLLSKSAGEIVK